MGSIRIRVIRHLIADAGSQRKFPDIVQFRDQFPLQNQQGMSHFASMVCQIPRCVFHHPHENISLLKSSPIRLAINPGVLGRLEFLPVDRTEANPFDLQLLTPFHALYDVYCIRNFNPDKYPIAGMQAVHRKHAPNNRKPSPAQNHSWTTITPMTFSWLTCPVSPISALTVSFAYSPPAQESRPISTNSRFGSGRRRTDCFKLPPYRNRPSKQGLTLKALSPMCSRKWSASLPVSMSNPPLSMRGFQSLTVESLSSVFTKKIAGRSIL